MKPYKIVFADGWEVNRGSDLKSIADWDLYAAKFYSPIRKLQKEVVYEVQGQDLKPFTPEAIHITLNKINVAL